MENILNSRMDKIDKEVLMKSISQYNTVKFFETFDHFELVLDESYFDYELLKAALLTKQGNIANFLISKGCRVRNPNEINLNSPLHLAIKLEDLSVASTILNKDYVSMYDKNVYGETPLYAAFINKFYTAVSAVLDYISNCNLSFNPKNKDDILHFHIACIRMHISSVKLYLSFGFDVNSHLSLNSTIYAGLTPLLYLLISQNDYSNLFEFVQEFIKSGVDVNSSISVNYSRNPGFTPLHFAAKNVCLELVQLLVSNGADCNRPNKNRKTPLHLACKHFESDDAVEIIETLLDHSACPVAVDIDGNTPIHIAFCKILRARSEEARILDKLISKQQVFKINLTNINGLSFFHIACTRNDPDLVNDFLNLGVPIDDRILFYGNFTGYTALHFAVLFNQTAVVNVLLKRGASINIGNVFHHTPLHLACQFTRLKFFEVYCKYERALAEGKPINIDWTSNRKSQLDIIKLLLLYGADTEAKNAADLSPLFDLCKVGKDAVKFYPTLFRDISIKEINTRLIEIIKMLLSNKADINCKNKKQWSIFHVISVNYLPNITDELMECLIAAGADINAVDKRGLTPLHRAALRSKQKIVKKFLKYKAKINVVSIKAETPLEMAISSYKDYENSENNEDKDLLKSSQSCIITLLENGSNVNIRLESGQTLLHYAASSSSTWLIEKLLYYGADINMEGSVGYSTILSIIMYVEDNRMDVLCVLFVHIQKLLALKLYVNDKIQMFFTYLFQNYKSRLPVTKYEIIIYNAFDECTKELNKMKCIRIDNYTSLYNVLLKDPHELSKYVRNSNLTDILERKNIDEQFPLYGYLLKPQYKKSLLRSDVLKSAKESLIYATNSNLPDLCYDSILRYLTNEEVVNLKAAVCRPESDRCKRKLNVVDSSEIQTTIKLQKK